MKEIESLVIDLEGEWETFNKILNTEGQNSKPPTNPKEMTMEMIIEMVINDQEKKHIPIAPSSEIVLRIEEISPLDVLYSPQHKVVIRRQRKKRK